MVGDLDDPERLVADLCRDDAAGAKAASRIAVVLKRLGSSTYDVAIKIITDIIGDGPEDARAMRESR